MFKQIGENIRILRNRKKLSQSDLGNRLKLTRQQISTYEKGNNTIPLTSINSISNVFDIPIDYLVKLDLSKYKGTELDELLSDISNNNLKLSEHISNLNTGNDSSLSLLDEYLKSLVKDQLTPIEDLLRKVLVKIDLTDLKYELNEEIKKANRSIGEIQGDKTSI